MGQIDKKGWVNGELIKELQVLCLLNVLTSCLHVENNGHSIVHDVLTKDKGKKININKPSCHGILPTQLLQE